MDTNTVMTIPISGSLGAGRSMRVDAEDYPVLARHTWRLHSDGYAVTNMGARGSSMTVYAHRVVMGPGRGPYLHVDHADRDPLNNTKANLRFVPASLNYANRGAQRNNTSGFKGVSWSSDKNKWMAQLVVSGRKHFLGYHADKDAAARAYDAKAEELLGDSAYLNFSVRDSVAVEASK